MDEVEFEDILHSQPIIGNPAFQRALSLIPDGMILEFGVYKGESLDLIAAYKPAHTIYGFDSFEGLPETWREGTEEVGCFKCDPPKSLRPNVKLVIGLFQDTLPAFLEREKKTVAFAHIDCDLYSSTKCILDNIEPWLVDGSILAFDEIISYGNYKDHEFKAFREFIDRTGYQFQCVGRRTICGSIVRLSRG